RISSSDGRPSRLRKPPGILPAAYCFSRYSTVSGKNGRWVTLGETVTAACTTVSPNCTRTLPAACFARRPVSMTRGRPANCVSMRCTVIPSLVEHPESERRPTVLVWGARQHQSGSVTQAEFGDEGTIAIEVATLDVVEEPPPGTDHLEQSATRVMILRVRLEVVGERVDPRGEQGHLDLGRTGVGSVGAMLLDDGLLVDHPLSCLRSETAAWLKINLC